MTTPPSIAILETLIKTMQPYPAFRVGPWESFAGIGAGAPTNNHSTPAVVSLGPGEADIPVHCEAVHQLSAAYLLRQRASIELISCPALIPQNIPALVLISADGESGQTGKITGPWVEGLGFVKIDGELLAKGGQIQRDRSFSICELWIVNPGAVIVTTNASKSPSLHLYAGGRFASASKPYKNWARPYLGL